jgi:hypothetical protein
MLMMTTMTDVDDDDNDGDDDDVMCFLLFSSVFLFVWNIPREKWNQFDMH